MGLEPRGGLSVKKTNWFLAKISEVFKNRGGQMRSICVPDGPPFEFNTRITPVAFAMQKPFYCRGIAQLVEQWSPKPRAEGSNPSAPAKFNHKL